MRVSGPLPKTSTIPLRVARLMSKVSLATGSWAALIQRNLSGSRQSGWQRGFAISRASIRAQAHIANDRRGMIGKDARHGSKVADIAVDHAEQRTAGFLVGRDAVEIANLSKLPRYRSAVSLCYDPSLSACACSSPASEALTKFPR